MIDFIVYIIIGIVIGAVLIFVGRKLNESKWEGLSKHPDAPKNSNKLDENKLKDVYYNKKDNRTNYWECPYKKFKVFYNRAKVGKHIIPIFLSLGCKKMDQPCPVIYGRIEPKILCPYFIEEEIDENIRITSK